MYFFIMFDSFDEGSLCYFQGRAPYSMPCQHASSPGLGLSYTHTHAHTHMHTHRNTVFFNLRVVRASLSATLPPLEGGIVTRGTVKMFPAVKRCPPQNRLGS